MQVDPKSTAVSLFLVKSCPQRPHQIQTASRSRVLRRRASAPLATLVPMLRELLDAGHTKAFEFLTEWILFFHSELLGKGKRLPSPGPAVSAIPERFQPLLEPQPGETLEQRVALLSGFVVSLARRLEALENGPAA